MTSGERGADAGNSRSPISARPVYSTGASGPTKLTCPMDRAFYKSTRPCHMWTPPFGKGFYERLCKTVGCSHMSGLSARLVWPLALMISAD
jgi:hypothetical protein